MKNNKQDNNEKIDVYSSDKLSKIKPGVKIGFLKFWIGGAIFFFVFSGLGTGFDTLDRLVISGLILTLAVEFLVNKIIIWMNTPQQYTLKYLPYHFDRSKILSLLFAFIYAATMFVASYYAIEGIMALLDHWGWVQTNAIGPIFFGLVYALMDYIWITIKNLIFPQYRKKIMAKNNSKKGDENV